MGSWYPTRSHNAVKGWDNQMLERPSLGVSSILDENVWRCSVTGVSE